MMKTINNSLVKTINDEKLGYSGISGYSGYSGLSGYYYPFTREVESKKLSLKEEVERRKLLQKEKKKKKHTFLFLEWYK